MVTRSQSGEEPDHTLINQPPSTSQRTLRFDDPPRSPSEYVRTAAMAERRGQTAAPLPREEVLPVAGQTEPTGVEDRRYPHAKTVRPTTTLGATTTPLRVAEHDIEQRRATSPARSCVSVRSTGSTAARVRQAQFEAEERLALLRRKELELESERIRRKLAFDIEVIQETEEATERPTDKIKRVENWIQHSATLREDREARTTRVPERGEHVPDQTYYGRPRSPTPPRAPRTRGVEQLVDALEKLTRSRPPRQVYDLPVFSGNAYEWFAFKAAMDETTRMYNFSATENMARLRNCLRGEAREAVSAMLYTVESPEGVMQTLSQIFGRPEVLIDRTIEDLRRIPRPGTAASELNTFAVKVQNTVSVLKAIDRKGYLHNPMLTRDVLDKLSPHLRSRWCDYAEVHLEDQDVPEIIVLSRFLMSEANRALKYAYTSVTATGTRAATAAAATKTSTANKPRQRSVFATAENESEQIFQCVACKSNHSLPKCPKFRNMDIEEKWDLVRKEKLCFKCIASRHRRTNCKEKVCGYQNTCRRPHHILMHGDREPTSTSANQQAPKKEEMVTTTTAKSQTEVKLKVCPVTVSGPRGQAQVYALFDEGSTVSLLDEDIAQKIGAKGPLTPLNIRGVNMQQQDLKSQLVRFDIRGTNDQVSTIRARTIRNMQLTPQTVSTKLLRLDHLKDLDHNLCYEAGRPRLLIGSDNWELIVTRELRTGKRNEPAASRTRLGWVIHGTTPRASLKEDRHSVLHVVAHARDDKRLSELVEDHFKIDALGVALKPKVRETDERAVAIFNRTARRVDGRYEVGLPWKEDNPKMPTSYDTAWRRLQNLERKLDKSEELKVEYGKQIENLLSKGYAEPCVGDEQDSPKSWYLPHFPVTNINKPGRYRLVFDAAAQSRRLCLNDFLIEGPDLLQSLQTILFRFRERKVAVTADIQEMFLQVKIRREDQPAQMFLWRGNDREHPPRKYKMTSMIFGASSSPFLAHSVRNRNAEDHAMEHPEAARAITEAHYMDDYVDSYANEEEAAEIIAQVDKVHRKCGFKLRGWNSNSKLVLSTVPEDLRAQTTTQLLSSSNQSEKTLGLQWNSVRDTLGFNTSLNRVKKEVKQLDRFPTKREALSAVMSLYDPLGLLSCYSITGKILLQRLWREKIGWDEALPREFALEFMSWLKQMNVVSELHLPRCYDPDQEAVKKQLHVFVDASETAYAAAVFWRLEKEDGTANVVLVAAKAKVAPLRTQTIPRLELQAAVIGARLAATVQAGHRWTTDEVTYWTDSRTVQQWIRNDNVRYTPYVAHRLGEIADLTRPSQWKWIPTSLNVADLATRPNYVPASPRDRWFEGPSFLQDKKSSWPRFLEEEERRETEDVLHVEDQKTDGLPDIRRFSKFERLVRATAAVLLFIDKCRKQATSMEVRHLLQAERLWLTRSQNDCFQEELALMKKGKFLPRTSRLFRLDPVLSAGLLCVNGRIGAADVPTETKRPVILDGRHPFVKLLVQKEHQAAGHANRERVVNDLRQRYWILGLRPAVRATARNCAMCILRKTKPKTPVMGDLPPARLEPYCRPFTNTGVDYFGPLVVAVGRRHEKRWGALFTCLTTRAVHLEVVSSLSTDSAIMALRRMAARRGWPAVIYSDNATCFRSADTELRAAYAEWAPALREYGLQHRVSWRFIPPGAPNQGGAWERLVRSVKVALTAALNQKIPKEETLLTLLAEAEHSINARPLTHVSVEATDPEAITPNHLLLGGPSSLPLTGPCQLADRRAWRASQALADEFWRRWVREYLPTLVPRQGAAAGIPNIQEGDLVVVVDANLPRNTWPRGVVERVYPGPDGAVRSADVRTRGGIFRRPTTKLAILPVKGSAESAPGGSC